MTVKELAKFTGKTERCIRNWVIKAAENNSSMTEKMSASSSTHPADYTINEVEAILINGSMSKDAVSILMDNARNKADNSKLIEKESSLTKRDAELIGVMVKTIMSGMESRVSALEEKKDDRLKLPAPKKNKRDEFNQLVRKFSFEKDINIRDGYHVIYEEMLYRKMGNVSLCAKNRGMKTIDYLEQQDLLDSAIAIIIELIGEING